jgi:trk system potassium uptake protein TrkA
MRIVFVGASMLTITAARILLQRRHEVVIVERDRERIEALSEELDCGFLHGDGSRPATLREADPASIDFLFCLTENDQTNIIAGLVGRSLGVERVITKVEDDELDHICIELGLSDTIIPDLTIARQLADIVDGQDISELALMIKGDARVFSFVAGADDEGPMDAIELPAAARVVCVYRDNELLFPNADTKIRRDDEIVILSHRDLLPELTERWGPRRRLPRPQ